MTRFLKWFACHLNAVRAGGKQTILKTWSYMYPTPLNERRVSSAYQNNGADYHKTNYAFFDVFFDTFFTTFFLSGSGGRPAASRIFLLCVVLV